MGQTLGEPITIKETNSCANSRYLVGSSCMQGWRINMEDAHTHLLSLPDDPNAAFFAVYDGHGGAKVSQYVSMHLHNRLVNNTLYAQGNLEEAIKQGFLELDEHMQQDEETKEEMSGTTAITVLIKDSIIYCGNVGDSRAVVSVKGEAIPLSYDHKPSNDEESKRIVAAGGWVEFNRVNGNLALSRAFGDFGFKQNDSKSAEEQVVTAYPEVLKFEISPEHEFVVLACDGIWDVMSNQEVVNFCRERLAAGKEPRVVCEELLDHCLAPDCELSGLGCDNMTVIIVCLLQDDPLETYMEKLKMEPRIPIEVNNDAQKQLVQEAIDADSAGSGDVRLSAQTKRSLIEKMTEMGLVSDELVTFMTTGVKSGSDLLVSVDTDDHVPDEQFTTPSQSPNANSSSQEPCSDDEHPPTHFKVPQTSSSSTPSETAVNQKDVPNSESATVPMEVTSEDSPKKTMNAKKDNVKKDVEKTIPATEAPAAPTTVS
ncbi:protein phosphatase 2C domain-containing protein [Ditylenchus destructor]|uniref:protein-serine/threonine phosphatase n=1 Tax=Ditylenchus destructor TaxID=166010 RepID=A0AAD4MLW1_9BILA|nr:protein phosphatase 2C domain-containing protein [Ditylenchus destructor]